MRSYARNLLLRCGLYSLIENLAGARAERRHHATSPTGLQGRQQVKTERSCIGKQALVRGLEVLGAKLAARLHRRECNFLLYAE